MSRAARQRRRKRSSGAGTRLLLVGGTVIACALVIGVIAAVGYVVHVADGTRNPCTLRPIIGGGSSQVFASDGSRLGFIHAEDLRSPVSWGQIPAHLKEATIAIEDQRFYKNNGVDVTGIFRSAVKDIVNGKALQGGSTITMQLMRNLYMKSDTRSLKQKIEEAKMALDYAKCRTKHEILTEYLNSVPYGTVGGQTTIGVQAAARVFFNKPVSQLNLEQAALLAGLPQAPSEYNPFLDKRAARTRRNEVLAKMAELHYVSSARAAQAEAAPLETQLGNFYSQRREDFFFEYVRQALQRRYGAKTVEEGGLRVYTTLDLNMQRLARKAIAEVLNQPEDPASAIVTLNPANGDIEAMAESESYEKSQYNLAADGHRQPGSTFKAIDLADALSRGIDPNSTFYSSHTLEPGWLPGYPTYLVKTFGGEQNGTINLVSATLKSDNTVYAQLAADLGEETVTRTAYAMGVKTHLSSYPAEALGGLTLGVTPLEMAVVYATLADGGLRNDPIAITKVVFPDGHVDESWGRPHRTRVLSEAITGEETRILHLNVLGGTATRSQIGCPTAAKTGTTSELYDAWLDGYNSEYSTVVWMGYPKRDIAMTDVHGEPQQGGYLPAEIWHAYMGPVTEGHPCAPLHESNTGISFQPFYGKFSTTGLAEAAPRGEEQPPQKSKSTPPAKPHAKAAPPSEAPSGPAAPPGPEVNRTGGATP
ncbi:MAG TPA: transglycosylase domain-containing protein [Solirubrobacteraceae bacterium]|jgi:penicillin-binding protein 1A|nr:transglycosylase domain-containing protein [Solirubrobacteraceae bacterium]